MQIRSSFCMHRPYIVDGHRPDLFWVASNQHHPVCVCALERAGYRVIFYTFSNHMQPVLSRRRVIGRRYFWDPFMWGLHGLVNMVGLPPQAITDSLVNSRQVTTGSIRLVAPLLWPARLNSSCSAVRKIQHLSPCACGPCGPAESL